METLLVVLTGVVAVFGFKMVDSMRQIALLLKDIQHSIQAQAVVMQSTSVSAQSASDRLRDLSVFAEEAMDLTAHEAIGRSLDRMNSRHAEATRKWEEAGSPGDDDGSESST